MSASYLSSPSRGFAALRRETQLAATQAYLSYKGLFLWLNWPAYVSNIILRPGLVVAMFALTGRFARGESAVETYVIGVTAFAIPSIVLGGVLQGFYYERSFGTLSFLFASGGNRALSFLARGILHLPNAALVVGAGLGFSALFLPVSFGSANWPAVCACYAAMALATTAFALCWGSLCIVLRDWIVLYQLTLGTFMVFSGVIIPRNDLPLGLGALGASLPTTHALGALHAAFDGANLSAIAGELALEVPVGVVYAVLGYVMFRAVEAHARRGGAYAAL
jgi:ABC-type polysaccharide/polyol phosphate export permease